MALSAESQKHLKLLHILLASTWLSSALTLTLLLACALPRAGAADRHGILLAAKFIDDWIIIPSAMGLLATSIVYSAATNWGWFRHGWIAAKWIVIVYGILFGTFFLGPRLNSLPPIAQGLDLAAAPPAPYAANLAFMRGWGAFQFATLIAAYAFSVYKFRFRRKAK